VFSDKAFGSSLAAYEPGSTIKGYRLVCSWGGNECEYAFIIRSDLGNMIWPVLPEETTVPPENSTNAFGVSMLLHSVSPNGLYYSFENTSNNLYIYGNPFSLYVLRDNTWEAVTPIIDNYGFSMPAFWIDPQSKTDIRLVDWRWLYGELPAGEYKFQKDISKYPSSDSDIYILEQQFVIS